MTRELQPSADRTPTRHPIVDRRVSIRAATAGPRPLDGDAADRSIVYVRPDQIGIDGSIDQGHGDMRQPNGTGGGNAKVNWQDRYRTKGPRELRP
jgi:hypothetical protein